MLFLNETTTDSFSGDPKLLSLIRKSKAINCTKGDYIFREGELALGVYLIIKGEVLCLKGKGLNPESLIAKRTSGRFIGNISDWDNKGFHYSGMATRDSELVFIQKDDFKNLLSCSVELTQKILSDELNTLGNYLQRLKLVRVAMLN